MEKLFHMKLKAIFEQNIHIKAASGFVLPENPTRTKPNFHYPNQPETQILIPEVPETRKRWFLLIENVPI